MLAIIKMKTFFIFVHGISFKRYHGISYRIMASDIVHGISFKWVAGHTLGMTRGEYCNSNRNTTIAIFCKLKVDLCSLSPHKYQHILYT